MRAARADANQPEIIEGLRAVGATVKTLHRVGMGCPDLLVGYGGNNYLIEVKDGSKPPSSRKLTPPQVEFFDGWRGQAGVATCLDEALEIIGVTANT